MAFAAVVPLIVLLLLMSLVAVIVIGSRERGTDEGIGTIRRVFLSVVTLAALATATTGLTFIVQVVLVVAFGPPVVSGGATTAIALSLLLVGGPIWAMCWSTSRRIVRDVPGEAGATSYAVMLHAITTVAALVAAGSAFASLLWLAGIGDYRITVLGPLLVATTVWAYHERHLRTVGTPSVVAATVRRLHVYLLATVGLALLGIGAAEALRIMFRAAYHAWTVDLVLVATGPTLWGRPMQYALAGALVGALVWWIAWGRESRRDASWVRAAYVYAVAVLVSVVATVTSAAIVLYHLLHWWFGVSTITAVERFAVVPGSLAVALVAGVIWAYHATIPHDDAIRAGGHAEGGLRTYRYLVAALGLATVAVGLTHLVGTLIGLSGFGPDRWRDPLILAVTLLSVGVPVWLISWGAIERSIASSGTAERQTLARRMFLYGTFAVSILLTLGHLSIVLFHVLGTLLGSRSGVGLLWDVRTSLAIVFTVGAISGFSWFVLRDDRERLAAGARAALETPPPPRAAVVAIATTSNLPLVQRLEGRLGRSITVWRRDGDPSEAITLSDEALDAATARIDATPAPGVMVLLDRDGFQVVPYWT
jgi:hypothetical protein